MRPALLKSHEASDCRLRIWFDDRLPAQGIVVRQGLLAEQRLTSVHYGQEVLELAETADGSPRLAPDNPALTPAQLSKLDGYGLVRAGVQLAAGDVVASLFEVQKRQPREAEHQFVCDETEYTPVGWEGAMVQSVTRRSRKQLGRSTPEHLHERIEITLRLEQPLAAGDILLLDGVELGIVSAFRADQQMPRAGDVVADLIVSQTTAEQLGLPPGLTERAVSKAAEVGACAIFARVNGARSLISHEPLGGGKRETLGTPHPSQPSRITVQHVEWLLARGLNQLLAELICTKSNDLTGAAALKQQTGPIDPDLIPAPTTAAALYLLQNELWAFGLVPDFQTDGSHVTLTVRPATRAEVLAESQGEIKKPDTIDYRSYLPVTGGLLCGEIYGDEGELNRSGHFELGCEIVPYYWRFGSPSILERLLGIDGAQLESVIKYRSYLRGNLGAVEWLEAGDGSSPGAESPSEDWLIGAPAIKHLLAQVPDDRLPSALRGRATTLVQDVLLIPPVWTRPLVMLNGGNFATSDLNDLYRRIVNRANRLRKLVELNAPIVILLNERRVLQDTCDALHANCLVAEDCTMMESASRPLKDLASICLSRLTETKSKRVEWSGQARAILDPTLADGNVQLPRALYDALRLQSNDPVLLTRPHGSELVTAFASVAEGNAIRLSRFAWERLPAGSDGTHRCDVHRPLSTAARAEALRLNAAVAEYSFNTDPLLSAEDIPAALDELAQAAAIGRTIRLDSPAGVLLTGLTPVVPFRGAMHKKTERPRIKVPKPPPPPEKHRNPTNEEIDRVIQTCLRKACIFTPQRSDARLPPARGRVGGLPCLPPDMPWPTEGGKPQVFLAQLPLDSLGTFPAGSLLTFFMNDGWLEGNGSLGNPVFIVQGDGLAEREPPAPELVSDQFELTPQEREELPDWNTVLETLIFEFEDPDPKVLAKFRRDEWSKYPEAKDAIRVGGWAHWIQSPESDNPFVAQLSADNETGLDLCDAGSMYVCKDDDGSLEVFLQFY